MKKRIMIILAVAVVVLGGVTAWKIYKANKEPERYASACWAIDYRSINAMADDSDLIAEGKVVSQTTQLIGGNLVCTLSTVKVTKLIKGEIVPNSVDSAPNEITVVQTGGVYEEIKSRPIEGAPLLKKGDRYLLYLYFSSSEYGNRYSVAGGQRGTATIKRHLFREDEYIGYGGGVKFFGDGTKEKEKKQYADVTFAHRYKSVEEMAEDAELIVEGKVVSQTSQLRGDLVFTLSTVKIKEIIAGEPEGAVKKGGTYTITVQQTGGSLAGIDDLPIYAAPLLEKGDSYLLYLSYSPSEYGNNYDILGANQGVAKIKYSLFHKEYIGFGGEDGRRLLGEPLEEVVTLAEYRRRQSGK